MNPVQIVLSVNVEQRLQRRLLRGHQLGWLHQAPLLQRPDDLAILGAVKGVQLRRGVRRRKRMGPCKCSDASCVLACLAFSSPRNVMLYFGE